MVLFNSMPSSRAHISPIFYVYNGLLSYSLGSYPAARRESQTQEVQELNKPEAEITDRVQNRKQTSFEVKTDKGEYTVQALHARPGCNGVIRIQGKKDLGRWKALDLQCMVSQNSKPSSSSAFTTQVTSILDNLLRLGGESLEKKSDLSFGVRGLSFKTKRDSHPRLLNTVITMGKGTAKLVQAKANTIRLEMSSGTRTPGTLIIDLLKNTLERGEEGRKTINAEIYLADQPDDKWTYTIHETKPQPGRSEEKNPSQALVLLRNTIADL
ncbi:MAG: hypothetical protein OXU45_09505 [Candidatus Melainabacteria bacterium]|nr:hypothetical protein [Candidatus Melainabacteria bacterium]